MVLNAPRRLSEGIPGLDELALGRYRASLAMREDDTRRLEAVVGYLERLIDLSRRRRVLVIGCGPEPEPMKVLQSAGFDVIGLEPVPAFVDSARMYLRNSESVIEGSAESIPLMDESRDIAILESVLEHVDSPQRSLGELYRVLAPGGVAFVTTTNRHAFSARNAEFNVPLFQFLPNVVKESFVFFHLHHRPSLANYSERPAVHWYSFSDLCGLGRQAGFGQFYSHLDLKHPGGVGHGFRERLKYAAIRGVQTSPWIRALALTQRGGTIFMVKRSTVRA